LPDVALFLWRAQKPGERSSHAIGNAGRRLNPDAVDSQTALEQAKAVARAERDKLGTGNESVSQPG
jgi:hypothetical protein